MCSYVWQRLIQNVNHGVLSSATLKEQLWRQQLARQLRQQGVMT
jgi:hypothetical protein